MQIGEITISDHSATVIVDDQKYRLPRDGKPLTVEKLRASLEKVAADNGEDTLLAELKRWHDDPGPTYSDAGLSDMHGG